MSENAINIDNRLLSSAELADKLNVSKGTLRNWCKLGLPCHVFNASGVSKTPVKRYELTEVINWLERTM